MKEIDILFSDFISDEDVEAFKKKNEQETLHHNAGFLLRALYSWILAGNNSKTKELSAKVLKDPVLSQNRELVKRIEEKGLSGEDLPFLKSIF